MLCSLVSLPHSPWYRQLLSFLKSHSLFLKRELNTKAINKIRQVLEASSLKGNEHAEAYG